MNRTSIQEYENNALQKLGFTHDFIEDKHVDYYAIVRNGKLIQESNEPFEANIENLHIKLDEEGIQLNGHAYCEPGEMEIYFLADDLLWVNAVPIDYASRWFWKNGCDGFDCDLSKE